MNYESLIFDIDGTLWDSRQLVAEGYNIQLRSEGLDHLCVDAELLKTQFGKVKNVIADDIFSSIPAPERYHLIDRCMEMEQIHMRQDPCDIGYPKVLETIRELSKKHRLFIVSNCEKGYPEICMEKLGITQLFSGHLCFGDTRTCKGETIKKLMADHKIASACYIGDTQGDADAAKLAGIPFVYCTYGFGRVREYWKSIENFAELETIF